MRKLKTFLLVKVSIFFSVLANGQGATLLKNDQGVSLSYTREFYKKCKETPDREYNIYKITVYLSNNSGKSIKMADSWVSNNNSRYLNCISEYDGFGSMTFKPSGDLNASPEWDTRGKPWPSNSTLKGTYYIAVPVADGEPPKPDWAMGGFVFIDEKQTTQPQASGWMNSECYKGLSYQYQVKELVNLNYQVHYDFKVRSTYKETVQFIMSLKDETGKERFGTKYTIRPGAEITFTEKMDKNYIRVIEIDKAWFPADVGKTPSLCDGQRENSKNNSSSSLQADALKAVDNNCKLLKLFDKKDSQSIKEYNELLKKEEAFSAEMERKYTKESDQKLFREIFEREFKKCQN